MRVEQCRRMDIEEGVMRHSMRGEEEVDPFICRTCGMEHASIKEVSECCAYLD